MNIKINWNLIYIFIISFNLSIILDIPIFRQLIGYLFLLFIPGFLILNILKLVQIDIFEKVVLSLGLSISALYLVGYLENSLLLYLGCKNPLSINYFLITINILVSVLILLNYKINNFDTIDINLNLSLSEKTLLAIVAMFLIITIMGVNIMNAIEDNRILLLVLIIIPIYVIIVNYLGERSTIQIYPLIIFMLAISLAVMFEMRCTHIIGMDRHMEYRFFIQTIDRMAWNISGNSLYNACLSVTILPSIYKIILNIESEFLFKYYLITVISTIPIVIYIISKQFFNNLSSFFISLAFMTQTAFVTYPGGRSKLALFFFALMIMVILNKSIKDVAKMLLFFIFMICCIVTHYTTAYIAMAIFFLVFMINSTILINQQYERNINKSNTLLFFSLIFVWYAQLNQEPFESGLHFIESALLNMNTLFIEESLSSTSEHLLGKSIEGKGIPFGIELVSTWLIFMTIGLGVISMLILYTKLYISKNLNNNTIYIKKYLPLEYLIMALICSLILTVSAISPYISTFYGTDRLYAQVSVLLIVFLICGIMKLSNFITYITRTNKHKNLEKNLKLNSLAKILLFILLVTNFFSITGVTYEMLEIPRAMTLDSSSKQYDLLYVYEQESSSAKWLDHYSIAGRKIYTDFEGSLILLSQSKIDISIIDFNWILRTETKMSPHSYIFVRKKSSDLVDVKMVSHNMSKYSYIFLGNNTIYNSGLSNIILLGESR